jgi:hypothetical protein
MILDERDRPITQPVLAEQAIHQRWVKDARVGGARLPPRVRNDFAIQVRQLDLLVCRRRLLPRLVAACELGGLDEIEELHVGVRNALVPAADAAAGNRDHVPRLQIEALSHPPQKRHPIQRLEPDLR